MAPLVVVVVALALPFCHASKYKDSDKVDLYVNKVGPYYNPHETYHYYSLPVCHPQTIEHKGLTLGEVLDGDRMAKSMYEIKFKKNVENKELCKLTLNQDKLTALRDAIEDLYYFEFVVDEIPVRGFIGHLEESGFLPHSHKIYLWTHLHFNIDYNGEHVISANVSTRDAAPVSLDKVDGDLEVKHTYTVQWHESKLSYKDRGTKLDKNFFPRVLEIHWLSIFNSMVLVLLLVGFVAIILTRILKNDFARYNDDDEESDDLEQDDFGWKIIHTDVFRFPLQKSLFCAVLGVGTQFLALAFGILSMAIMGLFNVHRHGAINTAGIVLFAFTSWVSGYVSANMYKKMGGEKWVWNINLTTFLFAGPLFIVWSIINSVAWGYGSTQALPWTTIILLIGLWLLVGYPLSVIGGIFGKNWANGFDAPCRTKNIVREIPPLPWYRSCPVHCLVGGFLPFSAISVELYYIFSTLWGRDQYTLWGILMIVYVMLLIVTASISIAMTYFQLNAEDYRWWWRSIFTGGTTALFVLLYSCFYYFKRSNMSGTLQATKFMGFTVLMCYVAFLMLGTVSFFASLKFIRYIYVNIKMD